MSKEELIAKMLGMGYALSPNTDYYYSRCWGKSGGDMEYVNFRQITYSKEYSYDNEDNYTISCEDIQELADWVLY
jgi:hypothetical protein